MKISQLKSEPNQANDPRLNSEEFRAAVRLVFEHLRIPNKMSNFRKYDPTFDWLQMAYNFEHPRHHAVVKILCRSMPTNFTTLVALRGKTREEALETLDKSVYNFLQWA